MAQQCMIGSASFAATTGKVSCRDALSARLTPQYSWREYERLEIVFELTTYEAAGNGRVMAHASLRLYCMTLRSGRASTGDAEAGAQVGVGT